MSKPKFVKKTQTISQPKLSERAKRKILNPEKYKNRKPLTKMQIKLGYKKEV